jgi:hypothetical protein
MSTARYSAAAAVMDNRLYVCGTFDLFIITQIAFVS